MIPGKVLSNVRGKPKAHPVGDGALGRGGGEPVGVADDPVGHKAAIAAPGDAQPFLIDLGILFQHTVRKGHQVVVINGAVFSPQVGKLVAPAVSAPWVGKEHKPALAGPILHLVVEHLAVDRFRAAVDI